MEGTEQISSVEVAAESRWSRTFRAFGHRNFRLFWFGQLVSLSGSWMQIVALSWLVYRLTDSPFMLGVVSFVGLLPAGLVSLIGGVVSDRFPRRNLILLTQAVLASQALVLTVLTWTGLIQLWHILVVSFVIGAANALEQPARVAFLMDIAGKADFSSAVGLNSSMTNAARSVGPVVAGLLISGFGEMTCFLVNFLTYLAVILAFSLMRLPATNRSKNPLRLKGDLLDGLKYAWSNLTIRGLLSLICVSSLLAQPYIVLMPVFASDVLGMDSKGYGLLMGTVGVGAVLGALLVAGQGQKQLGKWLVRTSFTFPVFLILFSFSRWMPLTLALLLLVSASQFTQQVSTNALLQLVVSDEFRGRMASFFALFTVGLMRVGSMQSGAVAEYWSTPMAISVGAGATIIWALVILWRMPAVRRV